MGREGAALKWRNYSYLKIDNEATLDLQNSKSIAVDVEISVKLGGRVTSVGDDGKLTLLPFDSNDWKNYSGSEVVNNSSLVEWKIKVEPGERFTPKIGYSFYTR